MAAQIRKLSSYALSKRLFDVLFSAGILTISALPVCAVALLIAIETRAFPLYSQERVGVNGKPFNIYKIRTMFKDADNLDKYFTPEQRETYEREFKVDNDPRVTRVGSFLRATSLDEFPQFFNALTGSMSIVGPRPITQWELRHFGDTVEELLSVRPGITGWWQATERNDATYYNGRRQELELFYVRNASWALDTRIVLKTIQAVLSATGK